MKRVEKNPFHNCWKFYKGAKLHCSMNYEILIKASRELKKHEIQSGMEIFGGASSFIDR